AGAKAVAAARGFVAHKLTDGGTIGTQNLSERLATAGFEWGVSDGN
ncbi:MAG: hypothetical protein HYV20_15545, partial [Gemmatimonadetes bacterium]|nr:hypothetical protein [Gemmatimonadota bacterium]